MTTDVRIDAAHATARGDLSDDLLHAYLLDMRGHEMLSGDEQSAIARLLREHRTQYRQTLLSTGFVQRRALLLLRASQNEEINIQEFCEISFRDQAQHETIRRQISETAELLHGNLASNDRTMDAILCEDLESARRKCLAARIAQRLEACSRLLQRIPLRQAYFDDALAQAVLLLNSMSSRLGSVRQLARLDRPAAEPLLHELRFMVKDSLSTPARLASQIQLATDHKIRFEEKVRELARSNLRLVVKVAKQYRNCGLSFLDLIQEGNTGLMESLRRFDERFGCRVSSYAMWWIRQSIIKALQRHSRHVRLPIAAGHLAAQFSSASDRIYTETGSRPSVEQLAGDAGVSTDVAQAILRASDRPLSLNIPLDQEHGARVVDVLQDDRETDVRYVMELSEVLQGAVDGLAQLSERERTLLRLRYGLDDGEFHSFRELSSVFSLTPQRLQQIEQRALRKLRAILERDES